MNIDSIKRRLLVKYPFFGSVVANSNFIAEPAIETAGTDGTTIYYNPNFIESITNEEQTFVFAHEICHIAFNHIFRSEGKDKELWNIATDSIINAFLKQDGLPMVEGGVDIPDAINYDAEEMYKKLLEEKKQQQQPNEHGNGQNQKGSQQQSGNNEQQPQQSGSSSESSQEQNKQSQPQQSGSSSESLQEQDKQSQPQQSGSSSESSQEQDKQSQPQQSGSSNERSQEQDKQSQPQQSGSSNESSQEQDKQQKQQDVGHDTHSMWDNAIKKKRQEQQSQSQQLDEKQNEEQEKKRNEEIKKLTELGEKEAFKQNKIARKKQLEELREALASKSHGHGSITNSERRNITDIGMSEPLIDWRRLLKEAVKYDVDWSYRNAGIEDGVVTAYLEEMPRPETEIVLDTSGSINETLLRNFLRECKNILQTSKVKVGCFDTQFYGFAEIKDVSDIDNLKFYGGGGTDFDVAVNAFTRRVENKIIFTDGYADMPSTPIDAIWIVFGGIKINPVGGKVIHIDEEQLYRLSSYEMNKESKGKTR